MLDDGSRLESEADGSVSTRPTFAVQFVFEVESESVAEELRRRLPGPDSSDVASARYRSYVDLAGLAWPVVGASIPYRARESAERQYATIRDDESLDRGVRSGTLALRRFDGGASRDEDPALVAATTVP